MKTLLTSLLVLLLNLNLFAQNLVPNPSFEDTVACPFAYGQVDRAAGWSSYGNSPDYFHTCVPNPAPFNNPSISSNGFGFQDAATGNAYCGFLTYWMGSPESIEYIGGQLSNPLTIGTKYYISMKVSLTLDTTFAELCCATSKIGILFSKKEYNDTTLPPVNNFAHIYTNSIITDTVNWTTIAGSFIADSAYQYIIIGNFFDTINTTIIEFNNGLYFAYYYLDDVCVSVDSNTCDLGTGVTEVHLQKGVRIYPNPTNGKVDFKIDIHQNIASVNIYNLIGQLVREFYIHSSLVEFDLSELKNGIYITKIKTGNHVYIQKLIISK